MDAHTAKERRLKTDIIEKNVLRRELERRLSQMNRWQEELTKVKKQRKKKKLEGTIDRYQSCIEDMKKELLQLDDDLEKRIKKEMTYSEEEIKSFQKDLEKHAKGLQKVQDSLKEAEKEKEPAEGEAQTPEKKIHLKKLLKEEVKKVEQDKKELKSEERDKEIFTLELKRITLDRKLYSS